MAIADIRERLRSLRLNSGDTGDFAIKNHGPEKPFENTGQDAGPVRSARAEDAPKLTPQSSGNETMLEKVVESPGQSDSESDEQQRSPGPQVQEPVETEEKPEKRIVFDADVGERSQEVEGKHSMTSGSLYPSPGASYQMLVEEDSNDEDGDGDPAEGEEVNIGDNERTKNPPPIVPRRLTADRTAPRPKVQIAQPARPTVVIQEPTASPSGEAMAKLPSTPHPSKEVLSRGHRYATDTDGDSEEYFEDNVDDRAATIDHASSPFQYSPRGTIKVDTMTNKLSASISSLMKSFNEFTDEAASRERVVQLLVLFLMSLVMVGLMKTLEAMAWVARKGVDVYSGFEKRRVKEAQAQPH